MDQDRRVIHYLGPRLSGIGDSWLLCFIFGIFGVRPDRGDRIPEARLETTDKLAGGKRRSLSGQGGLLNRMFGHSPPSPPKDEDDNGTVSLARNSTGNGNDSPSSDSASGGEKRHSMGDALPGRKSMDDAIITGDKKRRSGKAGSLLASARNSLHLPGSSSSSSASQSNSSSAGDSPDSPQNSFQKLGKQDPALVVPQGSHNNSAGESLPGSRSTFTVGVTEDRNKKCRRTMEDTHSYLYNFLPTPAPALDGPAGSAARHADTADSGSADPTDPASKVVETDNGYFAIFDGHAGTFAADWCGKKLHGILEDAVRKNPNTPIPELLDQTFTTVDQELEKLPLRNSGCTAVIAVLRWEDRIPNAHSATGSSALAPAAAAAARAASEAGGGASDSISQLGQAPPSSAASNSRASNQPAQLQQSATRQRVLYTANVGDARIILCRSGKALRLSYDHKGSDENEGKRVANAGGLILNNRVNGVLAVTRALGDSYMKDLVTGHPYTTETVIQPDTDEFIILACDGVGLCFALSLSTFPGIHISLLPSPEPRQDHIAHRANMENSYGTCAPTKKRSTSSATSPTHKPRAKCWLTTLYRASAPTICHA